MAANRLCQYEVYNIAVGDHDGEVDLLVPRATSGRASVFTGHAGTVPHNRITVPLRRFDDAVEWRALPGKVFLKVDVEGSEFRFLSGAATMLRALGPNILMEIHPGAMKSAGTDVDDIKRLLSQIGYLTYRELDAPDVQLSLSSLESGRQRNVLFDGPGQHDG